MPPELTKAHEKLDKAVKAAYGNKGFETEEEIVASLMKLYKEAVEKEKNDKRKISYGDLGEERRDDRARKNGKNS